MSSRGTAPAGFADPVVRFSVAKGLRFEVQPEGGLRYFGNETKKFRVDANVAPNGHGIGEFVLYVGAEPVAESFGGVLMAFVLLRTNHILTLRMRERFEHKGAQIVLLALT